jgi:hypothetical protein
MKKFYFIIFLASLPFLTVTGQNYCNEWINFSTNQPYSNQQYFRVSVWRDGIYRITYNDLQAASFPMPFNPKQLQLFYMGQEQFIHVEGEADGSFDLNDYIEFYGKRNDGSFDTRLYKNPDHQLNKSFSLFTDTSSYYLTVNINPFVVNRRIAQETDVNYIGYTSIPYFHSEAFKDYRNEYNAYRLADVKDSEYDEGEGWMSSPISSSPVTLTLNVPNISTDPIAPLAQASTIAMGGNSTGNQHSISVNVHGATASNNFYAFEISRFSFPVLSNSSIPGGVASFVFTPGTGVTNRTLVSFIKMDYPHTMNFSGETANIRYMRVPGNLAPGKSYLNMNNMGMSSPRMYMFSNDTLKRIALTVNGGNVQALVPTFGLEKNCFITDTILTSSGGWMQITPINTDPTRFARFINYQYIGQGNYLIVSHKSLMAKANDYKNYRSMTGYVPVLADVDELYDQFAYGITKHPLSIRNFTAFTLDVFTLKPEYLLLIGKSVTPIKTRLTGVNNVITTTANWNTNLVPTFGYPPSDMLLVSGINDTLPRPAISVGRISASTDADVQSYLDKITAHDLQLMQCPQEWMKQILHFGGGNNGFQQEQIKGILKGFEDIAEDTLMAANVETFLKTSSDPIQVNLSQYLQALIDSGSTLMTFVAHASGTSFDISTDIPQNYRNKDRYPVVLANSCFVGDIHDPLRRIAEDFVLLPDKGAIGFIAQPDVGYLENLQVYSGRLYQQIARLNYGGTIGQSMRNVIDSLLADPLVMSNQYSYYIFKSIITGMTLSGDPALVLNSFDRPDYQIKNSSVYFTPENITSDLDSFNVNIIVKNLGRAEYNPFVIHLVRKFPDGGTPFEKDTVINYLTYKDTVTIRLAVDPIRGVGPNNFDIYIDYFSNVDECNENNNTALNVPLLIQSSDILPVYPAEFSIVPTNVISLKASTVNPFATLKPYAFEIDTVDTFSSPFLRQNVVSSVGGVVKWQLPFLLQPDVVYYWRVSRDSLPGDTIHPPWKESSFIHKPGITGWSQAHYSQFKKDEFINIDYKNSYDSTFTFVSSFSSLVVRNYQSPNSFINPSYEINNVVWDYQMCTGAPSMHIVVIDSVSLKPWATDQYYFGNANTYNSQTGTGTCRARPEYYFIFRMNDPASRDSMYDMLLNDIPNGNFVVAYSVFSAKFSQWDPSLVSLFSSWGSDSITFLNDTQPYIFFTKKGDSSQTMEAIGDSSRPAISINATLGGNWSKGFISSVPIGPATGWTSLHWNQVPWESTAGNDSIAIDILGITPGGLEVPIPGFTGIQVGNYDVSINSIDATQYPRLRLRAYKQDETLFTPPQLKRWQIYYDEIPELALNPAMYFKLNKDTLAEGEEVKMEMAIENIGNVPTDSVLVDFYLFDNNRIRHNLTSPRYKTTNPGDTIIGNVSFSTSGYPGLNSLWIEANPRQDQPEQYHFNNLAEIKFNVNRDITNPILDVTFDGIHILNGDIVSGKPVIAIRLKDENKYLALNDTSDWQVFMKNPAGVQTKLSFEPIACSGPAKDLMKWCPAQLPDNTFRIEYNPTLMMDGVYELWVQASDITGNISGSNNYRVTFEVINKATITEVVNYPNPFSTSTKFVFTLTGSEVPEDFKIQIMTVSGKVVKEILRDELGPIHIGRNITQYAWNGKDEFGDQLANGIYLYRVLVRLNGAEIEKRTTGADKFFTRGWGKMYLMR